MTAAKPIVTLSIEHKDRELRSKSLVAYSLANAGFRVILGTTEAIDSIAKELPPCIIFHKSTFQKRASQYRQMGHKFVFLDEEGGPAIPRSQIESFLIRRYSHVDLSGQTCDMVFAPNTQYAETLSAENALGKEKFFVSGWPRFDIWRPENRASLRNEVQKIKGEIGEFVLFPSFFGFSELHPTLANGDEVQSWQVKSIQEFKISHLHRAFDFLEEVAAKLPSDKKLVIRPHPKDRIAGWRTRFEKCPNVLIIATGDIAPWIEASFGVIQLGSTGGVEATLAGKNVVRLPVNPIVGVTDCAAFEVGIEARSPAEAAKKLLKPTPELERQNEKLSREIGLEFAIDPMESSSDRIANYLYSLRQAPSRYEKPSLHTKLFLELIWLGSKLKTILRKSKGIEHQHLTMFEKVPSGLDHKQVMSILEGLKGSNEAIYSSTIAKNLIVIDKI